MKYILVILFIASGDRRDSLAVEKMEGFKTLADCQTQGALLESFNIKFDWTEQFKIRTFWKCLPDVRINEKIK